MDIQTTEHLHERQEPQSCRIYGVPGSWIGFHRTFQILSNGVCSMLVIVDSHVCHSPGCLWMLLCFPRTIMLNIPYLRLETNDREAKDMQTFTDSTGSCLRQRDWQLFFLTWTYGLQFLFHDLLCLITPYGS